MKFATLAMIIAAAGAVGAAAGCTSAPVAAVGDVPKLEVPPLSLKVFTGKPCRVFGVDQLGALGVDGPGTPDPEQFAGKCRWTADTKTIGISLFGEAQGLARVYAARGAFSYFEPTVVEAYPAVDRDTGKGTSGRCSTVVGIAEGAAFEVEVEIEDERAAEYGKPCEVSKQVASIALGNIKGGG
ncbi:DUF3558 family protein [Umezawaea tangerina]|uniref:Uncharacterized protein DUF3558 n=1 Tax=Umezawaea tangerina TaxID=84725 RepID=A0A2T0SXB0_9PSEU|nr:DUF3558 family protein [Umezawaea tangerina]PRY38045.1 uncharacterized protein DUF3558 [Umezawaea tangerina]